MGEQVSLVNARLGGRASTRAARCSLSLRGTAPLPLCGNVTARASREIAGAYSGPQVGSRPDLSAVGHRACTVRIGTC